MKNTKKLTPLTLATLVISIAALVFIGISIFGDKRDNIFLILGLLCSCVGVWLGAFISRRK